MNVKQFYIDIGGNYNDALAIMMNDVLIARMLTKFINGNSCEEMVSLYEKRDYRALFAAAHSLNGVAGNLALTPLFELASFITEATRHSDDVTLDKEILNLKEKYELIKSKYQEYIAQIIQNNKKGGRASLVVFLISLQTILGKWF